MIRTFNYDTIVALSTPPMAKSALAIVRLSGDDSIRIVGKLLRDPSELFSCRANATVYDDIVDGDGQIIDDVVISVYRSPKSYTGEDVVEITSHGSDVITSMIIQRAVELGARLAEPGEFSRRAFFAGKIGLEEAELIAARIEASSERVLRGCTLAVHEKYERIRGVYDGIIGLLAQVDAEIDFGESDQVAITGFSDRLDTFRLQLVGLLQDTGTKLANDGVFTVALVGPPNVGKSSVFNAILNFERSIVSPIPGTTRDYVEAFVNVDGYKVKLVDTAGIRQASESTEQRGIELGQSAMQRADIVLRITTPDDREPVDEEYDMLLHNKSDLDGWTEGLAVSALTGAGIPAFAQWLSGCLSSLSSSQTQLSIRESERQVLLDVIARLDNCGSEVDLALLAEDLRIAVVRLGELLGVNIGEDSLNHIFSKMCIGK